MGVIAPKWSQPKDRAEYASVALAEIGGDEAGMERIHRDGFPFQAAGQLGGKVNICQLGLAVGFPTVVTALILQVIKIQSAAEVRAGGHIDDARRGAGCDRVDQEQGETENRPGD